MSETPYSLISHREHSTQLMHHHRHEIDLKILGGKKNFHVGWDLSPQAVASCVCLRFRNEGVIETLPTRGQAYPSGARALKLPDEAGFDKNAPHMQCYCSHSREHVNKREKELPEK